MASLTPAPVEPEEEEDEENKSNKENAEQVSEVYHSFCNYSISVDFCSQFKTMLIMCNKENHLNPLSVRHNLNYRMKILSLKL